jgi:hypothetical protein
MHPELAKKEIAKMKISERLDLSKEKIQWMVGELVDLIALRENNALITYSPLLTVRFHAPLPLMPSM